MDGVDDVAAVAQRIALRAVWTLRALAVPVAFLLQLTGDEGEVSTYLLVAAITLVVYLPAIWIRFRYDVVGVLVTVDVVGLDATMAVSGGLNSPVTLLLAALPLASALLFGWRGVLGQGAAIAIGLAGVGLIAGGDPVGPLAAVAWSTAAACGLSALRLGLLAELAALLERRRAVDVTERAAAVRERERVAIELDQAAIIPLAISVNNASPGELDEILREASASIRATVAELHALSARPIVLSAALGRLAEAMARRSGLPVSVEHDGEPGAAGADDELLLGIARPVLREATSTPGAQGVRLRVARDADGGACLRFSLDGPAELDLDSIRGMLEGVRVRAEAAGGRLSSSLGEDGREIVVELFPASEEPENRTELMTTAATAFRALAALRWMTAGFIGLIVVVEGALDAGVVAVLVAGSAWTALTASRLVRTGAGLRERYAILAVDQLLLVALLALAGEAQREIILVGVGVAGCYGFALSARSAIAAGSLSVLAATLVTREWGLLLAGGWAVGLGAVLSVGRERAELRGRALSRRSREAVLEGLRAEEDERRTVARALHDEVLQLLLSARQDLAELDLRSDAEADARRTAVVAHRVLVEVSTRIGAEPRIGSGDPLLELPALAEGVMDRGGPRVDVRIDRRLASVHGPVLVAIARELVNNAARHAGAQEVRVRLNPAGEATLLEVADDGRGFTTDRLPVALREGHIGLATVRERVADVGGLLWVDSTPGEGTRIRIQLPEPAEVPERTPMLAS